jgi:hypothetical protein
LALGPAPCYAAVAMADPRALDAIRRIEQALARAESAAARPRPAPSAEAPENYERLRQAHDSLRDRVAGAIGEIDRILETEAR